MIFDSVQDKAVMNTIVGIVSFISLEAGRRYNVLQEQEFEKMHQERENKLAETEKNIAEITANVKSLEVEIGQLKWLKKRKDLVTVHLGESKRKRGRPVRAKLVKIA